MIKVKIMCRAASGFFRVRRGPLRRYEEGGYEVPSKTT